MPFEPPGVKKDLSLSADNAPTLIRPSVQHSHPVEEIRSQKKHLETSLKKIDSTRRSRQQHLRWDETTPVQKNVQDASEILSQEANNEGETSSRRSKPREPSQIIDSTRSGHQQQHWKWDEEKVQDGDSQQLDDANGDETRSRDKHLEPSQIVIDSTRRSHRQHQFKWDETPSQASTAQKDVECQARDENEEPSVITTSVDEPNNEPKFRVFATVKKTKTEDPEQERAHCAALDTKQARLAVNGTTTPSEEEERRKISCYSFGSKRIKYALVLLGVLLLVAVLYGILFGVG